MSNQKIKCDVENCKYNDTNSNECNLEEIKVSSTCRGDSCHEVDKTICSSFKEGE